MISNVVTAATGPQGGIRHCNLPCFSIEGFTNSFFNVSSCTCKAVAAANYTSSQAAWDGVFRPWVPVAPPVVGELSFNVWDGCTYSFGRNGAITQGGRVHNGKLIIGSVGLGSGTIVGDPMNISPPGTIITIRCDDNAGGTNTIWQGSHDSEMPDAKPVVRIAGCSPTPEKINLKKLSATGCICDVLDPAECPTSAECAACSANSPLIGWTFQVTGFTVSGCIGALNGTHKIRDRTTDCIFDETFPGVSPESAIRCVDLGEGEGVWFYKEGAGSFQARADLAPVLDSENCPPRPTSFTDIDMWGLCDCSGQRVTARYKYGVL